MVLVPFACRSCGRYVRLELGPSTEDSSPTTWYCRYCGTPETADLGAPLIGIKSAGDPSAPDDQAWNPKAAALVAESRQRVAELEQKEAARRSEISPEAEAAADEARRRSQRAAVEALISIDLSDVADDSK
jgi:hypothetical protein